MHTTSRERGVVTKMYWFPKRNHPWIRGKHTPNANKHHRKQEQASASAPMEYWAHFWLKLYPSFKENAVKWLSTVLRECFTVKASMSFVYQKEITSQAFISHTTARKNKRLFRCLAQHCENHGLHETSQRETEKFCSEMERTRGY